MKIMGYRLREAIMNAGYRSISSFSSECGFSRPIISQLCNDKYLFEITDYTLHQLCNALHVTPDFLSGSSYYDPWAEFTGQDKTRRTLFDFLVAIGRITPMADGTGRFKLNAHSGNTGEMDGIELSDLELNELLVFFQKRIDTMCDEYMEICGIHNRQEFIKQWHSKEVDDLIISRNKAVDELRKYKSQK